MLCPSAVSSTFSIVEATTASLSGCDVHGNATRGIDDTRIKLLSIFPMAKAYSYTIYSNNT